MTTTHKFAVVDVFTSTPFLGNPVAVVFDADGLDTAQMQAMANWTNLSETTFVLRATDPAADYHLHIFTPRAELPFAGHPTIGSAFALLDAGLVTPQGGRLVQQCGVGCVEIAVGDGWRSDGLSFRLPAHSMIAAPEADLLTRAMGVAPVAPPMIVDVGPRWVIAQLDSAPALATLSPDLAILADYDRRHGTTGMTLFAETTGADADILVRSFAPADGIAEDPVCGSGNGSVAAYRLEQGATAADMAYVASQGQQVGRDGRIRIRYDAAGHIHVGGCAVTCVSGTIRSA